MATAQQTYTPIGDGNFDNFGMPETDPAQAQESATDLYFSEGILALLCYIFGVISSIIVLVYEKKSEYVRYHAWQSVIFTVFVYITSFILSFSSLLMNSFIVISFFAVLYLAYRALKDSTNHDLYKLPYIGNLAENQVYGTNSLPY
ncbi:UPF0132 membrane protein [Smittium culicis]|uniref:UPF0132 membrane protein n=1 Tax=Smittium culicis TaxID=133412 RepID=A0A1R1XRU6_9FUNG|nr:UPF0132 membrane protein [Smittium culicis]